jgi:hypothetical protein
MFLKPKKPELPQLCYEPNPTSEPEQDKTKPFNTGLCLNPTKDHGLDKFGSVEPK